MRCARQGILVLGGAILAAVLTLRMNRPSPQVRAVAHPSIPVTSAAPPEEIGTPLPVDVPRSESVKSRPVLESAKRVTHLLAAARTRASALRSANTPYTERELAEVTRLERQANEEGAELARRLEADPESVPAVLDYLVGLEDEAVALRLVALIARSLNAAARERLARALGGQGSVRERRIACLVLSTDPSSPARLALVHAAQSDVDPSIRREAFGALAWELGTAEPREAALVREVAATRAACDPNDEVRRIASHLAQPPSDSDGAARGTARKVR